MSIPVIDIGPYLRGGADDRRKVADEIAAACEESGFFCITGHGVPAELVARTRQAAADFFALPVSEKRLILRPENRVGRGYYPFADRSLAYTLGVETPPDLQEAFAMGPPEVPDDPYYRGEVAAYFFGENRYPARPEAFRATVDEYFRTLLALGGRLMGAMALALGLDERFFADKIDRPACVMRLIRYPAQSEAPAERQLRAGAHTDYGTLTILRGDDVPGTLQVKLPRGGWTDLRPPADAFVCNLGDAMARWTGGALGVDPAPGRQPARGDRPARPHFAGVLPPAQLRRDAQRDLRRRGRRGEPGRALYREDPPRGGRREIAGSRQGGVSGSGER